MDCSQPGSAVYGFSREEYWSRQPFPSPGDLPNAGIEVGPPALEADLLPSELPGKPNQLNVNTFLYSCSLDMSYSFFISWLNMVLLDF